MRGDDEQVDAHWRHLLFIKMHRRGDEVIKKRLHLQRQYNETFNSFEHGPGSCLWRRGKRQQSQESRNVGDPLHLR